MDKYGDRNLLTQKILKTIKTLTESKKFWIGYSGGVDSHVLLALMAKAFANKPEYFIGAIHIHHGLSPFADDWVKHCEKVCADLQVPLTVLWVDANCVEGRSPEEVAREARYLAFQNFLQPDECLVLAHHQEDQAETILLRLFRGAGPLGLGGMSSKTSLGNNDLLRPLLNISKEAVLEYATNHQLNWITDESNHNTRFDRNFLRHEILPKLSARWPRVVRSLSRAGSLCLETATAVQVMAVNDLMMVQGSSDKTLSVAKLLQLEFIRRKGVIRYWIQKLGFSVPSLSHIERINDEILLAKKGAKPKLKISDYELSRVRGELKIATFITERSTSTL